MPRRRAYGQDIYKARGSAAGAARSAPQAAIPGFVQDSNQAGLRLLETAAQSGLAINSVLAQEYHRRRSADVDDLVLDVRKRFEEWKGEYNRQAQGRLGVNALRDYTAKYEELAQQAQAALNNHRGEIYGDLLARRLTEQGLYAAKEGNAWAERQRELWLASQLNAQVADFEDFAAANPDDAQGIAFRRQTALRSWAEKNPGLDAGEFAATLHASEFKKRMDGFLLNGDLAGARQLLDGRRKLAELVSADSPAGHWAAAFNNPGNVTVDGKNFAMYATPRDGLKAIYGRIHSYFNKGKTTPAGIIATYAPPSGNDTKAYIAQVEKRTGLAADKPIDPRDRETLAKLAGAILNVENSVSADQTELLAAADDFLANGEPKATGVIARDKNVRRSLYNIDPATLKGYGERLASLERAEALRGASSEAEAMAADIAKLPAMERRLAVEKALAGLEPEKRELIERPLKDKVREREQLDNFAARYEDQQRLDESLDYLGYAASEAQKLALVRNMAGEIRDAARRDELTEYGLRRVRGESERQKANEARAIEEFLAKNQET
ncbi:MAG: hypothetical protein NC489_43685, partial [Ruminococcus flavefaciens]|nr:hypothetical protein [Ruminococcus flavefaciens]